MHTFQWRWQHEQLIDNVEQLQAVLLANRQVIDEASFLTPISPAGLTAQQVGIDTLELASAVALIDNCISQQQPIVVYGDYDADGVIATTILVKALQEHGAKVSWFVPDRAKHGYGLSEAGLQDIKANNSNPGLLITVDNGIVAHEQVEIAKKMGWQVIITDHHQPTYNYPSADAIVHTTQLCGSGVAWILARELSNSERLADVALVAIATLADQVPLRAANRSIVSFGLQHLPSTKNSGLQALLAKAKLQGKQLSSMDITFGIAPRLNAAGRMGDAGRAVQLLLSADESEAQYFSNELEQANVARQDLTRDQILVAKQELLEKETQGIIIVLHPSFHEGLIGLVAGKLVDMYQRPAIVAAVIDDTVKGSARSIAGVDITAILRSCSDLLTSVGGHELAGGFSCKLADWPAVVEKLQTAYKALSLADIKQSINIDADIAPNMVGLAAWQKINQLQPFGQTNPAPILSVSNVRVTEVKTIGRDKQHLAIRFYHPQQQIRALWWGQGGKPLPDLNYAWQIAGELQRSQWQGRTNLDLVIKAARLAPTS